MSDDIKQIKDSLKQNVIHITSFSDADHLLYLYTNNKYVIFESITLKNYFISNTDRPIINCNSSYEKFIYEMNNCFCEHMVFNNVNFCNDFRILNMINKTNNLILE